MTVEEVECIIGQDIEPSSYVPALQAPLTKDSGLYIIIWKNRVVSDIVFCEGQISLMASQHIISKVECEELK